jgi:DNA-binding NtrC family response regulator
MRKRVIALSISAQPSADGWASLLFSNGFDVHVVRDLAHLHHLAQTRAIDVVVLDGRQHPISVVAAWRRAHPSIAIVLTAPSSSEALVLAAMRAGVSDYLCEPLADAELLASIQRVSQPEAPQASRPPKRSDSSSADAMVGDSPAIRDMRKYIDRVAPTDSNVLITGETGVGKEIVAGLIHNASSRRRKPCVSINCAAIPDSLLESELFGFERGAFTGADRGRDGTLKSADGGTVFFDEVGDMGLAAQAKILRAIEAKEVHRLGGGSSRVPLDVRIVAATNQDLERLVAERRFRKDLFYRLNVARIHLPPLRERLEDVPRILGYYIQQFNRRFNRDVQGLTPAALDQLRRHDWPGNIRELKNLLEAIYVNLDGQRIDFVDLPDAFSCRLAGSAGDSASERERLLHVLFATNWNKSKAAEELKWSRMTLYRKLAKYHVVRDGAEPRK